VGIRLHCEGYQDLFKTADRPLTDLDFMSYGSCSSKTPELFESLGYEADPAVLRHFGRTRQVYWSRRLAGLHCDVFFDTLSFCHDIHFGGRLPEEGVTITVTDLLLEKMQIVQINEKDLKDTAILLRAHEVTDHDNDSLNAAYVSDVLCKDWGFWYTFTTNLQKLAEYVTTFDTLRAPEKDIVREQIATLLDHIERKPKSTGWKLRSKLGTKKQWYKDVEEVSL
jgi:hypothetical protein